MHTKKFITKVASVVLTATCILSIGVIKPMKNVSANISVQPVVDYALAEVGYIEKKSDSNLYSKTANTSERNNYTKFGKELANKFYDWDSTTTAWCDAFVDWCFMKAYGIDQAKRMTYQYPYGSAYCQTSLRYYKDNGAYYSRGNNPQKGDQVFFYDKNNEVNHTGLVVDVNMKTKQFTYVDGNSGENTDRVCKSTISITESRVAGFGRPDFINGGKYSTYSTTTCSNTAKPVEPLPTKGTQVPTTTITQGAREYVATLYKKLLGRTASNSEIDSWALRLCNGSMSAAQVAKGFIDSAEYQNKKSSNAGYVDALYMALLGRNPDTNGRNYWISCLNNGWSRLQVLRGIVGSDEFKNRCKNYGITPGSV